MYFTTRVADAVERLKVVFIQIPETQMSVADASRLSGLERSTCRYVLGVLEDARLITQARNGLFIRKWPESPKRHKEAKMAMPRTRRSKDVAALEPTSLPVPAEPRTGQEANDEYTRTTDEASIQDGEMDSNRMELADRDRIAERAYERFEQRGFEHGHDLEDWLEAEREVREHPAQ
ncbi:MAG TPA: DUF2934 domain-containing protein [Vicinamibacterales bacterium]|nr:DUF2934 domain-containing protein [Vicinamibacterales bacterium]